jgi:hypothetical protein
MHARKTLATTLAVAATLVLAAPTAHAKTVDRFDRRAFDPAPVVTSSGYAMSGATAGELGGHLKLSFVAADGSLPARAQCERAEVRAVLTVAPGESFAIATTGEVCSHVIDGSPTLNADFRNKHVRYTGPHKHARVTDGMISFSHSFLGAQGSVGLSVRW